MFTYFTEIEKIEVIDRRGRYVGHPYDFAAHLDEPYPRVTHLIVSRGFYKKKFYVIPWKDLHRSDDRFQLRVDLNSLKSVENYNEIEGSVTVKSNILDQQVVDTLNRKVVRVNDLHFLVVDDALRIAHVDISFRGLVRRLGWERLVDAIIRRINRHARYLTEEGLVSWKYVQPLSIQEATGKIQLSVEMDQLRDIPPSDISTMLMELDPYQRAALVKTMDVQSQVDIITELELKWQKDLIEELDAQTVTKLLERMPADEATDLLNELSKRDASRMLSMLSTKKSREIVELMEHESDSAGGLMTAEFITLRENMSVEEAIDHIKNVEIGKAETIYNAFVVDEDGKLIGSVSFRQLLLAPLSEKIGDVMLSKPPSIHVEDSVKDVAFEMDKYNLYAIPVVDDDEILDGIITIDDVLHFAVDEAWGKRGGL